MQSQPFSLRLEGQLSFAMLESIFVWPYVASVMRSTDKTTHTAGFRMHESIAHLARVDVLIGEVDDTLSCHNLTQLSNMREANRP